MQLKTQSDVISLHVPLTDETRHMVDRQFLADCKDGVYIINTSRGAVVSTDDLADAIECGKVAGAALDVIEFENMTKDGLDLDNIPPSFQYLLQSPHTVMTPHVAGWTVESKYKLAAVLADKIINCLKEK